MKELWADEEIKGKILFKLTRLRKYHHSHTSIDNLPKGFPRDSHGRVKDLIHELIKEEILIVKPTSYGIEVSVNSEKREKILYYIEYYENI